MKKNSSQWSMSNPAGNAVCYRDAESACSQPASPMVAANSSGLPSRGGTWAGCHAVSLGQTHWFVLEGKGSKEHRGRMTAYCQALLLPLISCTSFWEAPCGLSFSRCFPPTPQGLEASFKAYWSENGILPIPVLRYPQSAVILPLYHWLWKQISLWTAFLHSGKTSVMLQVPALPLLLSTTVQALYPG